MNLHELIKLIEQWAIDRGLDRSGTDYGQMRKTLEEIAELSMAILKGDLPGIIDGVGDVFISLVIGNMYSLPKNRVDVADVVDEVREEEVLDDYNRGYQAKSVSSLFYSGFRLQNDSLMYIDYFRKDSIYYILHDLLVVCAVWDLELEDCIESVCKKISKFEE